jgi:hypothetical protein
MSKSLDEALPDDELDYECSPENREISEWEQEARALAVNDPSMIREAITLHQLLLDDETKLYDAEGNRLADQAACDAAAEREIKAFRILARMPCMTPEESQLKLAYFMEAAGEKWFNSIEKLTWEAYIDDKDKGNGDSDQDKIFLRTLYVNGGLPDAE